MLVCLRSGNALPARLQRRHWFAKPKFEILTHGSPLSTWLAERQCTTGTEDLCAAPRKAQIALQVASCCVRVATPLEHQGSDSLSAEGEKGQGGWIKDKYRLA
jgi:hypothetical protein